MSIANLNLPQNADFMPSLRFNERQQIATLKSNLNSPGPSLTASKTKRKQGQAISVDNYHHLFGNPVADKVSSSMPQLRQLVEVHSMNKQITKTPPTRQNTQVSRHQSFPIPRRSVTFQTSISIQPNKPQERLQKISPNEKLEAVNRSLLRSRSVTRRYGFNDCDLESQTEQKIRSDIVSHKKKVFQLTQMVRDHLKAENRPTRGLFYQMIFSKRLDKSRQNIWEDQHGFVDAITPESETQSPDRLYQTPTRTALNIAQQMEASTRIQVGVNGVHPSGRLSSGGWSSISTNSGEVRPTSVESPVGKDASRQSQTIQNPQSRPLGASLSSVKYITLEAGSRLSTLSSSKRLFVMDSSNYPPLSRNNPVDTLATLTRSQNMTNANIDSSTFQMRNMDAMKTKSADRKVYFRDNTSQLLEFEKSKRSEIVAKLVTLNFEEDEEVRVKKKTPAKSMSKMNKYSSESSQENHENSPSQLPKPRLMSAPLVLTASSHLLGSKFFQWKEKTRRQLLETYDVNEIVESFLNNKQERAASVESEEPIPAPAPSVALPESINSYQQPVNQFDVSARKNLTRSAGNSRLSYHQPSLTGISTNKVASALIKLNDAMLTAGNYRTNTNAQNSHSNEQRFYLAPQKRDTDNVSTKEPSADTVENKAAEDESKQKPFQIMRRSLTMSVPQWEPTQSASWMMISNQLSPTRSSSASVTTSHQPEEPKLLPTISTSKSITKTPNTLRGPSEDSPSSQNSKKYSLIRRRTTLSAKYLRSPALVTSQDQSLNQPPQPLTLGEVDDYLKHSVVPYRASSLQNPERSAAKSNAAVVQLHQQQFVNKGVQRAAGGNLPVTRSSTTVPLLSTAKMLTQMSTSRGPILVQQKTVWPKQQEVKVPVKAKSPSAQRRKPKTVDRTVLFNLPQRQNSLASDYSSDEDNTAELSSPEPPVELLQKQTKKISVKLDYFNVEEADSRL